MKGPEDQIETKTIKKYASSTDVARLAGVSQSAVSRTFSGATNVSEGTKRKVLEAAARLDYHPSHIPRIMLSHKSNLVAIVVGALHNPFYSSVLEQFTIRFQEAGHQTLLVHVSSDHALDAVIPRLASYRVDAIVSALAILSEPAAAALAKLKIPVISFNTAVANEWVSAVSSDNVQAGRLIAECFVQKGARSFAFISGPDESHASTGRLQGFRDRLDELEAGPLRIGRGDYRYQGGFDAALALFDQAKRLDAVFCANDLMAIGAMDAIRRFLNLRIPEDVLIAGFDDIPQASWASIDLTTFLQDGARMVDEALAIIAGAQVGVPSAADPIVIPARLIERSSTKLS